MKDKIYLENAIESVNDGLFQIINYSLYHSDIKLDETRDFKERFNKLAERMRNI